MNTTKHLLLAAVTLALSQVLVTQAQAGPGPQDLPSRRPALRPAAAGVMTIHNPKAPVAARRPAARKQPAGVAIPQSGLYASKRNGATRS